MKLGNKLLDLRKEKHLSQEEVADKLNVSRQTISKWETDQSTPDFDKIVPLCELYGITSDELLKGEKRNIESEETKLSDSEINKKRALGIGIGVLFYFIAVAWIMTSIPVFLVDPIVSSAVFLLICGIGTFIIVYTCTVYKKSREEVIREEREKEKYTNPILKQIELILSLLTVIIYLLVSFLTGAWHITWIIWIVYALLLRIVNLLFLLRGEKNEKE